MNVATDQWPKPHLITVDEYYRMAEVGLLRSDARVELIEGRIIDMPPIGSHHAGAVNALTAQLIRLLHRRAVVAVQQPLRLSNHTEPQPDLAVLRYREDFYRSSHPSASDVLLVIEVSDSTLRFDREVKLPLYARHGIPELWIVDLAANQLHRMRDPAGSMYKSLVSMAAGESVDPMFFADVQIELASLFA
jgi:Uma2 family endonuclease